MNHLMLDAAFPPSPQQLVADCKSVGADSVGLYILNEAGVPGAVRTPDYVAQVLQGGIAILPIIAPGGNPPSGLNLPDWGISKCPVVLDIEKFSSPSSGWIQSAINWLRSQGFNPGVYCNPSSYAVAIADQNGAWKWRADWTFQRGDPPPGWQAWQYSDNEVVNGNRYDISTVDDNLQFFKQSSQPKPPEQENVMGSAFLEVAPPEKAPELGPIQYTAHVDAAGELWVTWQASNPFGWHPKQLATGLMKFEVQLTYSPFSKQVHIEANSPDGHPVHAWVDATLDPNTATWGVEHPGW